jgi:hypothetical protein
MRQRLCNIWDMLATSLSLTRLRKKNAVDTAIDIEGFCYYTPNDKHVQNCLLKISAPIPEKFCRQTPKAQWVTRWKVYLLGDLSTEMKGVCSSSSGFVALMEEAVAFLSGQTEERKEASYACFYGVVDLSGLPLYPRSRQEIAHEIDSGTWPSYKSCSCSDCRKFEPEKLRIPSSVDANFILPPASSSEASRAAVPFRAQPLTEALAREIIMNNANPAQLPPTEKE